MRVLFIQKDFFPRYGLLCLASVIRKAGHICELVITDIDDLEDVLQTFRPDVAALTFTSGQLPWARETARDVKRSLGKGMPVVIGGPHPTFFPEIAREEMFDVVFRGEADSSFPRLLDVLESNDALHSVPNIAYIEGEKLHYTPVELPPNLNALPFPSYDLMRKYGSYEKMGYVNMRVSRGCPYNCSFCYAPAYRHLLRLNPAAFFRYRAVRSAVEEARLARTLFPGICSIKFDDDTFNLLPDSWLEEFAEYYPLKVGLPFNCLIRIDLVTERNTALLKEAGCTAIRFGLESGEDSIRNGLYCKQLSEESIRSGVQLLQRVGVTPVAINVVGAPFETIEQALLTYKFNLDLRLKCANCANLHIYPGTPFVKEKHELSYDGDYFYFTGPQGGNSREFENLVCLFPTSIFLRIPPGILSRLVSLPPNPLYRLVLWVGQALIKLKIGDFKLKHLLRLRVFAGRFFGFSSLLKRPAHP